MSESDFAESNLEVLAVEDELELLSETISIGSGDKDVEDTEAEEMEDEDETDAEADDSDSASPAARRCCISSAFRRCTSWSNRTSKQNENASEKESNITKRKDLLQFLLLILKQHLLFQHELHLFPLPFALRLLLLLPIQQTISKNAPSVDSASRFRLSTGSVRRK
ncbi:MAG TPA: hypothetical protein V6C97_06165 [Oculatellaceae cyanobacterium]